jgi:hypothetical protein
MNRQGASRRCPAGVRGAWFGCLALLAVGVVWSALVSRAEAEKAFPDVSPGTWVELPGTRLDSVLWRDSAGRTLSALKGSGSPVTIMSAWNGAAYDDARDLLFIPAAGGDSDYAGNEVYTFDLGAQRWRRDFDPTVSLIPYQGRLGPLASDPGISVAPPNRYSDADGVYPAHPQPDVGGRRVPVVGRGGDQRRVPLGPCGQALGVSVA